MDEMTIGAVGIADSARKVSEMTKVTMVTIGSMDEALRSFKTE